MRRARRRVVITGLGIVAPNGIGRQAFWDALISGRSAVDYISVFDPSDFPSKVAAEVRDFVPTDFITARRARSMARFSQFAFAASRLALDDADLKITPALASRIAICFGTSVNGCGDVVPAANDGLRKGGVASVPPWSALEYPVHAASSNISLELDITGPSFSVSANCCTGFESINRAVSAIESGEVSAVIAGACDAPLFPLTFAAFCALGTLTRRTDSPRKASRPYDLLRDGAVLSEGGAAVMIEDLDVAQARGANIYAEVLGYGAASEAIDMRKVDLTGAALTSAIGTAIRHAGLTPRDVDHINAHGSSLPDYDICDSNAFKQALGEHAHRIPITSIKSMIGQPISASGIFQIAAACLSIKTSLVPPTINQEFRDPRCDLDYVPNYCRTARVRTVLANGHGLGGTVSAMVIGRHSG